MGWTTRRGSAKKTVVDLESNKKDSVVAEEIYRAKKIPRKFLHILMVKCKQEL